MSKLYTISPDQLGRRPAYILATSLDHAITAFAENVGLTVNRAPSERDGNNVEFMRFTIGTGKTFIAYETLKIERDRINEEG